MRIQILGINYAPEQTGIAPYTTALAEHLATRHEVTVLTGVPHYPDWVVPPEYRRWRTDSLTNGVRVVRIRHFVPHSPSVVTRTAYETSWAAQAAAIGTRIPTDLVIAVVPALFGAHAARLIAHRHRAPYGLIVQDVMGTAAAQSGLRGGGSISALATKVERSALRHAAGVTTIHPRLAADLMRAAGLERQPEIIYNWTHVPPATRSRDEARAHFRWPECEVIALHSGNMGSKQNLEVVVDAARGAEKRAPHVRFVLAGGGNQHTALTRYARGCANLTFMGQVGREDYTDLLQSADVLLVNERPGMTDMSLPSKLTSYLSAGRPVVAATDAHSATGEFVQTSGGGVVVPAGDSDALLQAVLTSAGDQDRARAMAERGRQFAAENLHEKRALDAYSDWVAGLAPGR